MVPAFEHEGAARDLVHALKYRGLTVFAEMVTDALVDRVPPLPVVPVPRAWSRQIVFGVDPAREIGFAAAMGDTLYFQVAVFAFCFLLFFALRHARGRRPAE